MSNYDWLYFDLDNTILDFSGSSKLAFFNLFVKRGVTMTDEDYKTYKVVNHQLWLDFEKGLVTADVLKNKRWSVFLEQKGLSLDASAINEDYFSYIAQHPSYVPGAEELIKRLKPHFNLAIITNGLEEVQVPRLQLTGLDKVFDPIVISERIGVAKPAAAFFDHIQGLTGHPLHSTVLVIGDTLTSDIRGGIDYGFDTCWFNYHGINNKTQYHADYVIDKLSDLGDLLLDGKV